MHFFLIEKIDDGLRLARTDSISDECRGRLASNDPDCKSHYDAVFEGRSDSASPYHSCPFGYWTSTPVLDVVPPLSVSGIPAITNNTEAGKHRAAPHPIGTSVAKAIEFAATEIHKKEYDHLEAALHDVRELNRDITSHAEILLAENGFSPGADWDYERIRSDPALRHLVSIFCATRDLKSALDLHEIWRDPRNAANKKTLMPLHRHFYRQKQISAARLAEKQLALHLGATNAEMVLTESFLLIPKILIDNAIKYSRQNGKIRIDFIESGNSFRIITRNFGRLIKQAERNDVFRRGYRGKNADGVPGSGIGLWLARLIVEANGGSIDVQIDETERTPLGISFGETTVTIRLVRQFPPSV